MKLSLYELEDLLVKLNVLAVSVRAGNTSLCDYTPVAATIAIVSKELEEAKAAQPPEDQHKLWSCRVHLCTEEFDHIDDAEMHLVEAHGMSFGDDINPSYIHDVPPSHWPADYPPNDYPGPWG